MLNVPALFNPLLALYFFLNLMQIATTQEGSCAHLLREFVSSIRTKQDLLARKSESIISIVCTPADVTAHATTFL